MLWGQPNRWKSLILFESSFQLSPRILKDDSSCQLFKVYFIYLFVMCSTLMRPWRLPSDIFLFLFIGNTLQFSQKPTMPNLVLFSYKSLRVCDFIDTDVPYWDSRYHFIEDGKAKMLNASIHVAASPAYKVTLISWLKETKSPVLHQGKQEM